MLVDYIGSVELPKANALKSEIDPLKINSRKEGKNSNKTRHLRGSSSSEHTLARNFGAFVSHRRRVVAWPGEIGIAAVQQCSLKLVRFTWSRDGKRMAGHRSWEQRM